MISYIKYLLWVLTERSRLCFSSATGNPTRRMIVTILPNSVDVFNFGFPFSRCNKYQHRLPPKRKDFCLFKNAALFLKARQKLKAIWIVTDRGEEEIVVNTSLHFQLKNNLSNISIVWNSFLIRLNFVYINGILQSNHLSRLSRSSKKSNIKIK